MSFIAQHSLIKDLFTIKRTIRTTKVGSIQVASTLEDLAVADIDTVLVTGNHTQPERVSSHGFVYNPGVPYRSVDPTLIVLWRLA